MKFLIDNQLPLALRDFLLDKGHDAVHVLDLGMARASDLEVSQFASTDGRTIITKDEDFSILATLGQCAAPVIWVRFGNCRTPVLLGHFLQSLDRIQERLRSGDRVIQLVS